MYHDERGRVCAMPASWTDVVPVDPYVAIAGGRSLLRLEDLLALSELVAQVRSSLASRGRKRSRGGVK